LLLAALLLVAMLTVGCGPTVREGTVSAKSHQEPYVETWTQMLCGYYGQYGCTVWIPIVHQTPHPEAWFVTVRRDASKDAPYSYWSIDRAAWDRLEVGSPIKVTEDMERPS
jgi:hypothetical protein